MDQIAGENEPEKNPGSTTLLFSSTLTEKQRSVDKIEGADELWASLQFRQLSLLYHS
jgi:hypothetical protein